MVGAAEYVWVAYLRYTMFFVWQCVFRARVYIIMCADSIFRCRMGVGYVASCTVSCLSWNVRISSTACEDIVNSPRGYRQQPARISSQIGVAVRLYFIWCGKRCLRAKKCHAFVRFSFILFGGSNYFRNFAAEMRRNNNTYWRWQSFGFSSRLPWRVLIWYTIFEIKFS